jgi:ABC-type proline/glycine betaine transport system ATPase subunit
MREALTLAEHIVVMGNGRVLHSENTNALRARHPGTDAQSMLRELLAGAAT